MRPSAETDRLAERRLRGRLARDRSLILLLLGALLFTPPVATAFDVDATLFGAPSAVIFVFAVWIALIIATARVARDLDPTDAPDRGVALDAEEPADEPPRRAGSGSGSGSASGSWAGAGAGADR